MILPVPAVSCPHATHRVFVSQEPEGATQEPNVRALLVEGAKAAGQQQQLIETVKYPPYAHGETGDSEVMTVAFQVRLEPEGRCGMVSDFLLCTSDVTYTSSTSDVSCHGSHADNVSMS